MLIPIHSEITIAALQGSFKPEILKTIISANQHQDGLAGQAGHDEYHYDNNRIDRSNEYLKEQRVLLLAAMRMEDLQEAWKAFGRLLHTAQDLYAHSNYVSLWLARFPDDHKPSPGEIDPLDEMVLKDPGLRSGRLYYPLELFSFIPGLGKVVLRWLPKDSHAWMNLDRPERGPLFQYAFSAAVKRSQLELELTRGMLDKDSFQRFIGR